MKKSITKCRKELVKYREGLGFTQKRFADILGVSRSFYGHIENGTRNPSYGLAKAIANELNVSLEAIFFDIEGFKMKQKVELSNNQPDVAM